MEISTFWAAVLSAVCAYLLGSISFGVITTRVALHKDIRTMGSGNTGMTNVLRSVGAGAGAVTGVGDFAKGVAAIALGRMFFSWAYGDEFVGGCIAAGCVLLGHLFPVFFGFKGGKGVMTSAGILLLVDPYMLLGAALVFGVVFLCSRIISLASLATAAALPLVSAAVSLIRGRSVLPTLLLSLFMSALVIWMHRSNIKRLREGTEKKLSVKK